MAPRLTCPNCGKEAKLGVANSILEKAMGPAIIVCEECQTILRTHLSDREKFISDHSEIVKLKDWRIFSVTRMSNCAMCNSRFPTGTAMYWSKKGKKVCCTLDFEILQYQVSNVRESGLAGRSAQERGVQVRALVTKRYKDKYGVLLGGFLDLWNEGKDEKSEKWFKGSKGEKNLASKLQKYSDSHGYKSLHDRKMPRSKGNIDHILITDRGIFVIDAKNFSGKIEIRSPKNMNFEAPKTLYVSGYKKANLLSAVRYQSEAVKVVLAKSGVDVPVFAVLDFLDAPWPRWEKIQALHGVLVGSGGFVEAVESQPPQESIEISRLFKLLADSFEPNHS